MYDVYMKVIHWDDIHVTATIEEGGAHVDFYIYDVVAHSQSALGVFDVREYKKKDATSSEEVTTKTEEAQPLIHGSIKWDACSHVHFGDEGYVHLCGKESFEQISEALKRIFKEAGDILKEGHNDEYF